MAAICLIIPNFVEIGQNFGEMWQLIEFLQDVGHLI